MWNDDFFLIKRKEKIKVIRTIVEVTVILFLIIVIVNAMFELKRYKPVPENEHLYDKGFISLSYFGVARSEDGTLIDDDRLREHLAALKASGYQTITQKDIYDYYNYGEKLPEKALYLFFEDGRRDTAIFAQKIMEDMNYKATALTYANKFDMKDPKFLLPKDLLKLKQGTFWELGTNGYRLEFINVFDRYRNFLGVLTSNEFSMLTPYIDEAYNHYLMDFIRDKDGIPLEDREAMTKRISYDYQKMREVYQAGLGAVPDMYVLMHANSPQFGSNQPVGVVNEKWIHNLFKMNFNREGESLNKSKDSIYNLTRLQPQAYWYTNHLLMRVWDDTKNQMAFVSGDTERKSYWDTSMGASEFRKNIIVLTSLPNDRGFMRLKNSEAFKDFQLRVNMEGNKVGCQSLYLRGDEQLKAYIKVEIKDNVLYVYEKDHGDSVTGKQLFSRNLRELDGLVPQSIAENQLETEKAENKAVIKYSNDLENVRTAAAGLREQSKTTAATIKDGSEPYIPEIGIGEKGHRRLDITLNRSSLTILVDGKTAVKNLAVTVNQRGYLCLESAFGGYGYSQRNIIDDVYDGVFTDLVVSQALAGEDAEIYYDNRLKGSEKAIAYISDRYNHIVDWFIETF